LAQRYQPLKRQVIQKKSTIAADQQLAESRICSQGSGDRHGSKSNLLPWGTNKD
jgi:hypothetical protein